MRVRIPGPHAIPKVKNQEEFDEWMEEYWVSAGKTINEVFDYLEKEVERTPIIITRKKDNKLYEVKLASTTISGYLPSRVELYIDAYPAQELTGDYITLDELIDYFYVEDYAMKRILSLVEGIITNKPT